MSLYEATFTHDDIVKRQSGSPKFSKSTTVNEYTFGRKTETKAKLSLIDEDNRRLIVRIILVIRKEILSMMSD